MSTNQKLFLSFVMFAAAFVAYYFSFHFYDGNYDLVIDLINNNDLAYNLAAISEWCFVFGALMTSITASQFIPKHYHKWTGLIVATLRITLVALTFSTLNELVGLNNYLDPIQFPVFWGLMALTTIYSYVKYKQ